MIYFDLIIQFYPTRFGDWRSVPQTVHRRRHWLVRNWVRAPPGGGECTVHLLPGSCLGPVSHCLFRTNVLVNLILSLSFSSSADYLVLLVLCFIVFFLSFTSPNLLEFLLCFLFFEFSLSWFSLCSLCLEFSLSLYLYFLLCLHLFLSSGVLPGNVSTLLGLHQASAHLSVLSFCPLGECGLNETVS